MTVTPDERLDIVFAYHERTKHHLDRFARSQGYLDWDNQPDPFRRFEGVDLLELDLPREKESIEFDRLYTQESIVAAALNRDSVSRLLYYSLSISAWKQLPGTPAWPLRVQPSSGNLHPVEAYLVAGAVEGLSPQPGVFHYAPDCHGLERRRGLTAKTFDAITGGLSRGSLLAALTSIQWRTSWKYGERAFRYVHLDLGHALGALAYAAATLGWRVQLVHGMPSRDLDLLLGTNAQQGVEAEEPACLVAFSPGAEKKTPFIIARERFDPFIPVLERTEPLGKENRLSRNHHAWPVIDQVTDATRYDGALFPCERHSESSAESSAPSSPSLGPACRQSAHRIIRQRRSALAMDGETALSKDSFYRILQRLSPRAGGGLPFEILPGPPQVSLAIFVHRVEDLAPGLYLLVRDPSHEPSLRSSLGQDLVWDPPEQNPVAPGFYLLRPGDFQDVAQRTSCNQAIAGAGAMALAMLGRFEPTLQQAGSWFYPRLHWEAGLIGQALYLEAEAAGMRATGIGCYFDDAVHRLLGIRDRSWQDIYQITLGRPIEDPRLQSLKAYPRKIKSRPDAS